MKFTPLLRRFYQPSAEVVAPALLGHFLLRRIGDEICGGVIVETEAYIQNDPSCHAFVGETPRNKVMWGRSGHAYVYFIYGCYYCFNAVCLEPGRAEAVLVRAVEPKFGVEMMQHYRPTALTNLTNGPGKLCMAMQIDRSLDGVDLCDATSPLFIARNPKRSTLLREQGPMITTTRIGIRQAADWPLRFYLDGSTFISRR